MSYLRKAKSLRSKRGKKSFFAYVPQNNAVRFKLHKNGVRRHVRQTLIRQQLQDNGWIHHSGSGSTCVALLIVVLPTKQIMRYVLRYIFWEPIHLTVCCLADCSIANKTKKIMQYGLLRIMLNIVETGIWSKPDRKTPFGSCSTQHSALIHWRRVLPTEASKRHTTPGITQSSDERVSYVISLALVSLELEKSGAPRARSFFYLLHRRQ